MSDFKAKDISIRVQKKLLGSFAKKNVVKMFVDDVTADLMDNLYLLAKSSGVSKKESEKIIKNIIKVSDKFEHQLMSYNNFVFQIIIKIGVLFRNDQFNQDELNQIDKLKNQLHNLAMIFMSYHTVEFSYDSHYANQLLIKIKILIKDLLTKHLTQKSIARIDFVFAFFANRDLMDQFFQAKDGEIKEIRCKIMSDMNKLIEKGFL